MFLVTKPPIVWSVNKLLHDYWNPKWTFQSTVNPYILSSITLHWAPTPMPMPFTTHAMGLGWAFVDIIINGGFSLFGSRERLCTSPPQRHCNIDMKFMYNEFKDGLKNIHENGAEIVIVSNLDARIELEFSMYKTYKVIDMGKMRSLQ